MKVTICTSVSVIYTGACGSVSFPSSTGNIQVLPMHAPLYTKADYGIIDVDGQSFVFTEAMLEVSGNDDVLISCAAARALSDLSDENIQSRIADAEKGDDKRRMAFEKSLFALKNKQPR